MNRKPPLPGEPASADYRELKDLVSVGPETLVDLRDLGITKVSHLRGKNAEELYRQLCAVTGMVHDICVQDVLHAAIEQANNPDLPKEQCQWHYWSRVRKGQSG